MNVMLSKTSLRHLWRHKWQTILLVLGIVLGVAVVVAIDYANESSKRALSLSTQSLTGTATHSITGSGQLMGEEIFSDLATRGYVNRSSPIVEGYAIVEELDQQPLLVFGIDPFWDYSIRDYYGDSQASLTALMQILTNPGSVLISADLAEQYAIGSGDLLNLEYEGRQKRVVVSGLISNENSVTNQTLQGILLTDIATAQEVLNKNGYLDRIELILEDENEINQIREVLPPGVIIQSVSDQNAQVENMVAAFQLNLTALSLLALVVGLFLIYNTMTFSVVQRRETIGIYRSLGFFRFEIFQMILFESVLIGFVGTIFGIISGAFLGKESVELILRTINDLYFVTTVRDVSLPFSSIIKGGLLGTLATVAVSIPPAFEATRITPRSAQLRSGLESSAQKFILQAAGVAVLAFIFGSLLLFLPVFENLWWAFSATLLIVLGFAILAALGLYYLLPPFAILLKKLFGLITGMSARVVHRSLSRTAVAVSSLMVAISVTIGMTIMIESFRATVNIWLDETLVGDVYISVPDQFSNQSSAVIDPELVSLIQQYQGVEKIDYLYTTSVGSDFNRIQVNVITNQDIGKERLFVDRSVAGEDIWQVMQNGAILISEPLANRINMGVSDNLMLISNDGPQNFPIAGVFYDYASNQGHLLMTQTVFEKYWSPMETTAISISAAQDFNPERIVRDIQILVGSNSQDLLIRDNQTLKSEVLRIFDQTFAITNALRFIATLVSIIGIMSAVILILMDRKHEIGMLKAIGLRTGELWRMILTETGIMGLFAGLFAAPTGVIISLILIYVINLRSFGWTIQFHFDWLYLFQGILIAILSAIAAGIYPVFRVGKMTAIQVLRDV